MVEKREVWTTSDGKEFSTKAEAEAHEEKLTDPTYALEKRIIELEAKLLALSSRVNVLEHPFGSINTKPQPYFDSKPHPDVGPVPTFMNKVWYGTGKTVDEAINNLKEVKE